MQISLCNISISYYQKKILKNINFVFESGKTYALIGSNGSGKSSLVKVIAGVLNPKNGTVKYHNKETSVEIERDDLVAKIAWVAPYINLYEEFSAEEIYKFQSNFKKPKFNLEYFLEETDLKTHRDKRVKYYSSGMKQRLKLALALFFETQLLILDEPTINLDQKYQKWYLDKLTELAKNSDTTIIIASNVPEEYALATELLKVEDYK